MEKSIDTLRAEMWRDRYTAILNQYHSLAKRERLMREEYNTMAQDLDDFYEEKCDLKEALLREEERSKRLQDCLKSMVDAGTDFLMSVRASIDGIDGSREAQFRDAIEAGKEELDGK